MRKQQKLRLILRKVLVGMLILLLVMAITLGYFHYKASTSFQNLPEQLVEYIEQESGLAIEGGSYQLNYWKYFPYLSVVLADIAVYEQPDSCDIPVLEAQELLIKLHPLKLMKKEIDIDEVAIRRGALFLERESDGGLNLNLKRGQLHDVAVFEKKLNIRLENVRLDYIGHKNDSHHKLELLDAVLAITPAEHGASLLLNGSCKFEGLLFKPEKGPFMKDITADLDLRMDIDSSTQTFRFPSGLLRAHGIDIALEGTIHRQDTSFLQLDISAEHVPMTKGLPLLNTRLQERLARFHVDQGIDVEVHIAGVLGQGDLPVKAIFKVDSTRLEADNLFLADTYLEGDFDNYCIRNSIESPEAKCFNISIRKGLLHGQFPIAAEIHSSGIPNSDLLINGEVDVSLTKFNPYIQTRGAYFLAGQCKLPFQLSGNPTQLFNENANTLGMEVAGAAHLEEGIFCYQPNQLAFKTINADFNLNEGNLSIDTLSFELDGRHYAMAGTINDFLPMALGKKHQLATFLSLDIDTLDVGAFFSAHSPELSDEEYASPMKRIQQISQQGKTVLSIHTSYLQLEKLHVTDASLEVLFGGNCEGDTTQVSAEPCLFIPVFKGSVYGNIPLEGQLSLDKLQDPKLDMQLEIAAPLQHFSPLMPPGKLNLEDGHLKLEIEYQGALEDYSGLTFSTLSSGIKGKGVIKKGELQYLPNGYEVEDLNAVIRFDEQRLYVDSLLGIINTNQINTTGYVENFLPYILGGDGTMKANLKVQSPCLDFSTFQVTNELDTVDAGGKGQVKPTLITQGVERVLQRIEGELEVCTDELLFRNFRMTDIEFHAALFQQCTDTDEEMACVLIDPFRGRLWGSAPMLARLKIEGLSQPHFEADVQAQLPLIELNRMFPPGQFSFQEGQLMVDFQYDGTPDDHFDREANILLAQINGNARISHGHWAYLPKGFEFKQMNAGFEFDQRSLRINSLATVLNNNQLLVEGFLPNFMPFLLAPSQRLQADLDIRSPHFSFDYFYAPQKFLNREEGSAAAPTQFTAIVDTALEQITAKLRLQLDTVSYRYFMGETIDGVMTMRPDYLRIDDVNMKLADGRLALNGQVSGLEYNMPEIDVRAKFEEANIRKVFYAFENFGQDKLLASNIDGTLNADLNFQAKSNANYELIPDNRRGSFHLEVKSGELIDFEALEAMQGALFKKRNMSHIQFANLENTFTLEGQNLYIDNFYVVSNVLDFGIEGTYNLGQEHDIDLLFEVPISNLFRKDIKIAAADEAKGRWRILPLYLKASKEEDEFKLKYRMFKGNWQKK